MALLGASGVGKSTLLNGLLGTQVMATQELGAVHKGRHTTVTREPAPRARGWLRRRHAGAAVGRPAGPGRPGRGVRRRRRPGRGLPVHRLLARPRAGLRGAGGRGLGRACPSGASRAWRRRSARRGGRPAGSTRGCARSRLRHWKAITKSNRARPSR
nr:GTPase RsgA [Angustibacter aerolatus]